MKIAAEQDVAAALEEAERRRRDRGRRPRPPRGRDVHRPRPRGRAAGDPADPAAGGEARGGPARRRDRARVGARLVPRGPARPTTTTATGTSSTRRADARARRRRAAAGPPGRAVLLHAPADARPLRRRAAAVSASIPSCRSPTTASRSARATRTARAARRCATSTARTPARCSSPSSRRSATACSPRSRPARRENGAGPRPLTSELLGALEEPTAGTLWRDVWHHGYGHVITAFVMAPAGGGDPGDIGDTSTAIRDPFFWRWHRHIDDANFDAAGAGRAVRSSTTPPAVV